MKKSELTQLTQLVELLVEREIRKQLPQLLSEAFQKMAGKSMVVEHAHPVVRRDYVGREVEPPSVPKDPHEFRASLKELFAGVTPVTRTELEEGVEPQAIRTPKQYTKDPVLNQILNETTSDLKSRERMTGLAAFQGGYNPGTPPAAAIVGAGEMMSEAEMPTFARGQAPVVAAPAPIQEGHAPLAAIPEGISALDVAKAGVAPPAVTEALTNYGRMKKILEQSKGKRY
jgi:hypothetical protein